MIDIESSSPLAGALRFVLVGTRHPGNIGAAARAIKTMGFASLVLVAPRCFPADEARARACGATDVLDAARVVASLDEALRDAGIAVAVAGRPRDLAPRTATPRELAPRLVAEATRAPVALVFGAETNGLTTDEVARCDWLVRIPADPAYPSLNLAAAVQVIAYELRLAMLAPAAAPVPDTEPARHGELERLYERVERALLACGFLDPRRPGRLMQRLRRLAGRARIEPEELAILRGALEALEAGRAGRPASPTRGDGDC